MKIAVLNQVLASTPWKDLPRLAKRIEKSKRSQGCMFLCLNLPRMRDLNIFIVNSSNAGISAQIYLTFSFDIFATLL